MSLSDTRRIDGVPIGVLATLALYVEEQTQVDLDLVLPDEVAEAMGIALAITAAFAAQDILELPDEQIARLGGVSDDGE